MSALPVLYSFRRCPYAIRARLALAVAQQPYQLHEVLLRDKPAALLAASPKGTVPVLVLQDGRVLEQSLDVMCWALQRNDPADWLRPSSGTLEEMLALVGDCDTHFKPLLDRCKYPQRYPDINPAQSWESAHAWLAKLNDRLADTGQLHGMHTTLADAAIFPFVRQFAAIDPVRWSTQPMPSLQVWLAHWLQQPLFMDTMRKPEQSAANPPL